MRLFGRILGVIFALSGVAILGMLLYALVSEGWPTEYGAAGVGGVLLIGFGLVFAGWYYLRTDPDVPEGPQPTSSFTRFLVNHRHQLKVLSQTGAAISFVAIVAECFGHDPTKRAWLPLLLGAVVLNVFAKRVANPEVTDNRDWMRVPGWIRQALPAMEKALGAAAMVVVGISLLSAWAVSSFVDTSAYHLGVRIFAYGLAAFMYALQALFFQHGELRDESDVTIT
jgi:hypothetical protein